MEIKRSVTRLGRLSLINNKEFDSEDGGSEDESSPSTKSSKKS